MPNYPSSKIEMKAWNFAKEKHKNQVRKFSNQPYFDAHVQKVNGILKRYISNPDLLSAALLHDVIEDCYEYDNRDVGYYEIEEIFGEDIASIVLELTSDDEDLRVNYFNNKTGYLIDKMLTMSDSALVVKLCDRLQNISDAFTASPKFRLKYYIETLEISKKLRKLRKLTVIQSSILLEIESKLKNINSIFDMDEKIVKIDED